MTVQIGKNLIKIKELDSTNNYATTLCESGNAADGSVVWADEQINGRGQFTNSWESESGKNLTFSVVLYPTFLPILSQFEISKMISVAIVEVLNKRIRGFEIKWPNDIYFKDKKVGGILIENSIMGSTLNWSVIGIGLNVNQVDFKSDAPNPVSLFNILGKEIDREKLLKSLMDKMTLMYQELSKGSYNELDKKYLQKLYRKDQLFDYSDGTGQFRGTITGVNEIGQLIIRDQDQANRVYHFKEVVFL